MGKLHMPKVPRARDCMRRNVLTVRPDMDMYEAIEALIHRGCAGACVLDEAGRLVGILTEKDCLRVLSGDVYANLAGGRVRDYMSEAVPAVSADMDLFAATQLFLESNFGVLPVLDAYSEG